MNLKAELARADEAVRQAQAIRDRIAKAIENTDSILNAAEALGVKLVGIGKRDDRFKQSKGWPFGDEGHVFADGRKNDRPVAWLIAAKSRISGSTGNSGEHSISGPTINGIYEFRDGFWRRTDAA